MLDLYAVVIKSNPPGAGWLMPMAKARQQTAVGRLGALLFGISQAPVLSVPQVFLLAWLLRKACGLSCRGRWRRVGKITGLREFEGRSGDSEPSRR
ncbi:hypothetical protein [Arthrobacter sp. M2012083]|uniref:hypothetical protein n=1 Tax=Arthrobacter sp. M2012083 TaxID=1197706 RepID=UPI0003126E7E|nr:hypothetical protein [Arthrobacter sp. M2012083]